MKANPITAKAVAKVYTNSVAKAIGDDDLMSTGTGDNKPSNNDPSPDPKPSGTPEAVRDIQVSQTGGYGDVFYPKSPFYGGGFDTGLDTSNVGTSSKPQTILETNDEMEKSKNKPIQVETPEVDMTPIEAPKFISSGTASTSDSGRFVGPYERRQRQRAVRQTGRQRKRGAVKEARIKERMEGVKEGTVKHARLSAKLQKAQDIKAEANRMAGSNVDAYKTKFRGSGNPAVASNTFKSISDEVASSDFSINRNRTKPSLTTKTTSSGINKNATAPFKMKGYMSEYKK